MKYYPEHTGKQSLEYINSLATELSLIGSTGGKYGFRTSGSSGEARIAERIRREMLDIGLQDVRIEKFPVDAWALLDGILKIPSAGLEFAVSAFAGSPGTPRGGISGEIVDVGKGRACDYDGLDVNGKIILCSVDPIEDYWINVPAEQAKIRAAACMIISYSGETYSADENALGCFDLQGAGDFPVVNISRKTASAIRTLMDSTEESITAELRVDIECASGGKSCNVTGIIPGVHSDRYIILGAHMDGYFNSYQDDALGVAAQLSVAKAIISSEVMPEHTIIVSIHGSEEYGVLDSKYDWCIGAYYATRQFHPDWFGKADVFLNFDAFRPDAPALIINAAPEYSTFLGIFAENLKIPDGCWPDGVKIAGLHGPWSDDYNYTLNGIPGLISGKGVSQWGKRKYHTHLDDCNVFEEERRHVEYAAELYLRYVDAFDSLVLPPLDFSCVMNAYSESLETAEIFCLPECEILKMKAADVTECAKKAYEIIRDINGGNQACTRSDTMRMLLFETYRLIQQDLQKLDVEDNIIFAHESVAENCSHLMDLREALNNRALEYALEILSKIDLNRYAVDFDRQVYDLLMERMSPEYDNLYWGRGRIHRLYNGYGLAERIRSASNEEDILKLIDEVERALQAVSNQLRSILNVETDILERISDNLYGFICMRV